MRIPLYLTLLTIFTLTACSTIPGGPIETTAPPQEIKPTATQGSGATIGPAPTNTPPALDSGIEGQVFIGPTCGGPVRIDASPCPDLPYQAEITILDQKGEQITQFKTDVEGRFKISLAPGDYVLRPESPGALPRAGEMDVTVEAGDYTQLVITYDSGMR